MTNLTTKQLANLIKKASKAHHKYEKNELKGEYDKNWAEWYAKWILKNLPKK